MTQEQAKKMTEWMYRCPYESAAGIVPVSLTEGRSVIGVTLRPDHMNIWNIPHAAELTATLAAIDTLIGAVVTALKADYDRQNTPPED